MRLLQNAGLRVRGIDVNPDMVNANRAAGLDCLTTEEFADSDDRFDLIIASHVIEHFRPADLLSFLDWHLDRLDTGGHLIITTPLLSRYFYDDFDHVRPYQPVGIGMVFGGGGAQVQYYARNRLALRDIWFRRGPFRLVYNAGLYVDGYSRLPGRINRILAILFKLTRRIVGRTDGWMGLYQKV